MKRNYIATVVALVAVVGGAVTGLAWPTGNTIYGLTLDGHNISHQSVEEVKAYLEQLNVQSQSIRLVDPKGKETTMTLKELGISVDVVGTLTDVMDYGYERDTMTYLMHRMDTLLHGKELQIRYKVEGPVAESYFMNYAKGMGQVGTNATITLEGDRVVHHGAKVGRKLDVTATMKRLQEQLQEGKVETLELVINESAQPTITDKDLVSIQEVRTLVRRSKVAQEKLSKMSQEQIDKIVKAVVDAAFNNATKLAKMANEETGFGKWEDKVIKNTFASMGVYETLKNTKTIGIIGEDKEANTIDIATPVGVVAGLIPSTNPTSTVIYKTIISLKAGNTIVFSPHPNAKNCILETVNIISDAAIKAGAPEDSILCITNPSIVGTNELMKHKDTNLILATGGEAMVRAAYSSGTPAIGVGPGNGPAFIDKSANVKLAIKRIIDSKTFDNGVICASEQSIVIEKSMEETVLKELKNQGAYVLNEEESERLAKFILRANGTMNPQIVGKSVEVIANLADLTNVPKNTKVLVARENKVGHNVAYSREKLTPILAFYVEENVEAIMNRCREILLNEGAGHTFSMHVNDEELVKRFALNMPVSRILVNTPSALGGIGASTNLVPALTLGCGAIGGSSTSNNIGPLDLINVKRVAYGIKEIEELGRDKSQVEKSMFDSMDKEELINLLVQKLVKELA